MEHLVLFGRLYIWVCADFDDLPRDVLRFCAMYDAYGEHEVEA